VYGLREDFDSYFLELHHHEDADAGSNTEPFVEFINRLAQAHPTTLPAISDAGFLDMVLCIFLSNFLSSVYDHTKEPSPMAWRGDQILACNSVLSIFYAHPEGRSIILKHPVHSLWPKNEHLVGQASDIQQTIHRQATWSAMSLDAIKWRFWTIYDGMHDFSQNELIGVYLDLLGFAK
jgi:hypothetical protein